MEKKYRIGIDARTIFSPYLRGTGKTLLELYKRLPIIMPNVEFYFYFPPQKNIKSLLPSNNSIILRPIDIKGSKWNLWENVRLPLAILKDKINLLHCPAQTAPYWKPVPTIVTIHDVIPLKIDDGYSLKERKRLARNIKNSIKKASHIITVSNFSKKDILELFPEACDKISVIYWSVSSNYKPISLDIVQKKLKLKYGINSSFFFAFGGITPRKNLHRLIESFLRFKNQEIKLVIAGLSTKNFTQFISLFKNSKKEKIINVGFIPEEDVPYFLNGAIALIYPSLYEGFGLPILEAFACGCPVITSNRTSMPEIAGDAALFIDPEQEDDILKAMYKIYESHKLRKELINKGFKRIKKFNWEITVQQIAQLFKSILK